MVAVKLKVTLPVAVTLPSAGSFNVTIGSVVSGILTVTVKLAGAKAQLLELSQARTFHINAVLGMLLIVNVEVFVAPVMLIVSFAWKVPVRLW